MKKSHYIIVAAATLFISSTAWAGALTIPNTFTAGSPAVAADVNANFAAGKTAVDDNNTRITALQNAKAGYATAVGAGNVNSKIALTATGQAVVTLTLNAPAAGFAIVTGYAGAWLTHANTTDIVVIRASSTSGDVSMSPSYDFSVARAEAAQPANTYVKMISITSVIPVVAGANLIYLNAVATAGTGHSISQPKLTAIYVPNAY